MYLWNPLNEFTTAKSSIFNNNPIQPDSVIIKYANEIKGSNIELRLNDIGMMRITFSPK